MAAERVETGDPYADPDDKATACQPSSEEGGDEEGAREETVEKLR